MATTGVAVAYNANGEQFVQIKGQQVSLRRIVL